MPLGHTGIVVLPAAAPTILPVKRKLLLAGGTTLYVWVAAVLYAREVKARKGHRRTGVAV